MTSTNKDRDLRPSAASVQRVENAAESRMSSVATKEAVARTREFLDAIPFNHLLGIQISRAHPDGVTLHCKVKKELLNSNKVLHGGVSASIADAAVGVAIQHRFAGKRAI